MSRVIGVDSLKKQLNILKNGNNIMEDLTIHHFPFRTPEAFSSEGKTIWAPIFDDKGIRYRYDSIKRGLSHSKNDNRVTREMVESLEWFNEFIETKAEYEEFRLNDGETMIFDNRRVLHARTDYEDVKRHLLRIRVS